MVRVKVPFQALPQMNVPPIDIDVYVLYVVFKWKDVNNGFAFRNGLSRTNREVWGGVSNVEELIVPLDPITAVSLGLVTPDELGFPVGLIAAFEMLQGNSL